MKPLRLLKFFFLITLTTPAWAQQDFDYRRQITGIDKPDWYTITLPPESFSRINRDFSDLRLYSFVGKDTTEIPYLVKIMADDSREQSFQIPVLNRSRKEGALFLTFELEKDQKVNSIDLNFQQDNFFAFAKLEGSNNQSDWFEIIDGQRLLSIKNENSNFKVQSVNFPVSQYRFLRATINSDTKLTFLNATLRNTQVTKGNYSIAPLTFTTREEKKLKQTIIDVKLANYVPVSHFQIDVAANTDYHRSFQLDYVADSTNTPKGWIKNYQQFYNGYLTSYTPNHFDVTYDLTKELRITINNLDNAPLSIRGVVVSGPEVRVVANFASKDSYLYYGKPDASKPSYDITYFQEKIPPTLATASLRPEENIKEPVEKKSPLFENQLWLWVAMIVVIGVLGFFTLRMMKAKPQGV
jgi:hypothetical protein